jgi:hypothetical protein
MKIVKLFIILIVTFVSGRIPVELQTELQSKPPLRFRPDGTFKIAQCNKLQQHI